MQNIVNEAMMNNEPNSKALSSHRILIRTAAFWALASCYGLANAATYSLPANIGLAGSPFSSCSFSSGTTYNCTNAISLGNNDIVNVTSTMTLNIRNNAFSTGTQVTINSINGGILTVTATEDMNIGSNFTGVVNLSAPGKTINFGTNLNLTGNVSAGTLNFGGNATTTNINGTCTATNSTSYPQCSNPNLAINNPSITSGTTATSLIFTVSLSKATSSSISASYVTSNGTAIGGSSCTAGVDYISQTGTATIATGSLSTTLTVSICGNINFSGATNKTLTVALSNPSSGVFLSLPSYGTGTIVNPTTLPSPPDHYEISFPSASISCLATPITITACANSSKPCTSLYTTLSGAAGLTASAGTLASSSVTFNSGVANTTLSYPSASNGASASVTLSGVPVTASNSSLCCPDGVNCVVGNSCSSTFSNAGFIFSNTANGTGTTIPTQVAGVTSPTYYLRAVKINTATKACETALTGTTDVNFGYECNNPTSCTASNLLNINSTSVARNNSGSVSNFLPVSFTFDANGNAPFTVNYSDVGQVKLYASKTASGTLLSALTGSSNAFVVAPHHFSFSGISASPIKAGNNFNATVTAYNGLSTPTATPNFGKETIAESVVLSFNKYQPTGASASNGIFSGSVGTFTNGAANSSNLNWSEVGTIDLIATLTSGSYLGSGLTATGNTGTTGALRFIPDHFNTTVTQGCNAGGFTYSGQPFTVTVTAKNGLSSPTTTVNYDGSVNTSPNFSKLVTLSDANSVAGSLSPTSVAATAFAAGIANATPTFTFTASPTAPATIKLRAVDTDSISSATGTEGTANIRSGRLQFSNAYGSELQNLALPLTAQYWNGTSWTANSADSCTTIAASNFAFVFPVASNNNLTACETAVVVTGSAPVFTATLSKPGANNNGWTDLTLNLATTASGNQCTSVGGIGAAATSAANSWLQYNWRGAGNTNPTARANFGVYKGNKKQIYFRELY